MKSVSDYEDEVDDQLETINMGGVCAAVRLLQARLFGVEQIHRLIKRKVASVAEDDARDEDTRLAYGVKKHCIDIVEDHGFFALLHYFKKVNVERGDGFALFESMVFTDEAMRCFLVVECDPFLEVKVVDRARTASCALRDTLAALTLPFSDITFCVFTPKLRVLPPLNMRERCPQVSSASPRALTSGEELYLAALLRTPNASTALRGIVRSTLHAPGRGVLGCDPPKGYTMSHGKTIVPRQA